MRPRLREDDANSPTLKSHESNVLSQLGYQAVSVAGALLILAGYASRQRGILS
jgi:hypothetical protein